MLHLARARVSLRVLVGVTVAVVGAAWAAPLRADPYIDTKKRFSVEPPAGWSLAPLPGDTLGMVFRKTIDGVPASLRVMVKPLAPGETIADTLAQVEAPFRAEIGFKKGAELPSQLGSLSATRRSFTVTASGDARTLRAVELHVAHAFGNAHIVHFETLDKKRGQYTRDIDRFLASYKVMAGRATYAPLVGRWTSSEGPDLILEEDGRFQLGPLSGGYRADGGKLSLRIAGGEENYRYLLEGNYLTLESGNLGGSVLYKRSGGRVIPDEAKVEKPKPLTREALLGTWRVVNVASTEVLRLQLAPSGAVSFGPLSGQWRYQEGRLTISSVAGETVTYAASIAGGRLLLSGGDLEKETALERE